MRSPFFATTLALLLAWGAHAGPAKVSKARKAKASRSLAQAAAPNDCEKRLLGKCLGPCADAVCRDTCEREAKRDCAPPPKHPDTPLWLQLLLLAGGPLVTLADGPRLYAGDTPPKRPLRLHWDLTSYHFDVGIGVAQAGTFVGATSMGVRTHWFGALLNGAVLLRSPESRAEFDAGPAVFFGGDHMSAALSPSFVAHLTPAGDWRFGGGLRTATTLYFEPLYVLVSPLVAKAGGDWLFHLRLGLGWRFTPSVAVHGAFEHRAPVESAAAGLGREALNGMYLYFSYRGN